MAADSSARDAYSHKEYFDAFQQFMQTGEKDQLTPYLEDTRPEVFLSVYRNGFIRASSSALESNFPSLVKLWGADYFAQVAAAYVNIAPPSSATLIGYGFEDNSGSSAISFIDFLQQDLTDVIDQYPYVLDICRLDQAWLESLNADGESFLTLADVQELISQGVDLGELPLRLVDSSRLVNLEFDIFELWGQLRFGDFLQQEEQEQADQNLELKKHDNSVIFWQRDYQVQAKPLSEVEAVFIKSLKQSKDFDTATNQALTSDESFDISTLFAELLTANLLQQ